VRDNEYFDYSDYSSEMPANHESEYESPDSQSYTVHEPAQDAAKRFFESEPEVADYIAGYDKTRSTTKAEEYHTLEDWRTSSRYDADEEYMTRLADARRARQLRREKPGGPNPAVRVNVERTRTSGSPGDDWIPPADEEFDTFRKRYSHDILSAPSEASVKEVRPRGKAPVHRQDAPTPLTQDGSSPLRYLLAIVLFGVLGIMSFLVVNNRSLRRDLDTYQARIATIEDNVGQVARLTAEVNSYQEQVAELTQTIADFEHAEPNSSEQEEAYTPSEPEEAHVATRPSTEDNESAEMPAPPMQQVTHTVSQGDTLSRIATLHYGSNSQRYVDLISEANNITNPNNIRIDDVLIIPPLE